MTSPQDSRQEDCRQRGEEESLRTSFAERFLSEPRCGVAGVGNAQGNRNMNPNLLDPCLAIKTHSERDVQGNNSSDAPLHLLPHYVWPPMLMQEACQVLGI